MGLSSFRIKRERERERRERGERERERDETFSKGLVCKHFESNGNEVCSSPSESTVAAALVSALVPFEYVVQPLDCAKKMAICFS